MWSSPKCLNRLCLTVFSSLRSSLLLVHIFLPNYFLPVNFAFNMLWYSTPWTAPPFSNDPLWLTLFVEGVNDRLLDHCRVSSVPRYCAFKEQEIPTIYTVWMVIYWNSNVNILIFWDTDFWLSLTVSSNHQNYESFTFWNKLQEKKNFCHHILIFLRCGALNHTHALFDFHSIWRWMLWDMVCIFNKRYASVAMMIDSVVGWWNILPEIAAYRFWDEDAQYVVIQTWMSFPNKLNDWHTSSSCIV